MIQKLYKRGLKSAILKRDQLFVSQWDLECFLGQKSKGDGEKRLWERNISEKNRLPLAVAYTHPRFDFKTCAEETTVKRRMCGLVKFGKYVTLARHAVVRKHSTRIHV